MRPHAMLCHARCAPPVCRQRRTACAAFSQCVASTCRPRRRCTGPRTRAPAGSSCAAGRPPRRRSCRCRCAAVLCAGELLRGAFGVLAHCAVTRLGARPTSGASAYERAIRCHGSGPRRGGRHGNADGRRDRRARTPGHLHLLLLRQWGPGESSRQEDQVARRRASRDTSKPPAERRQRFSIRGRRACPSLPLGRA